LQARARPAQGDRPARDQERPPAHRGPTLRCSHRAGGDRSDGARDHQPARPVCRVGEARARPVSLGVENQKHGDPAGAQRVDDVRRGALRPALLPRLARGGRSRERRRPGIRRAARRRLLQSAQDLHLRGLERNPAQHHLPDDSGTLTDHAHSFGICNMDFKCSEEQRLLADTVQRFLRAHYSFEKRRAILDSREGWSREIWRALAGLGVTGVNIPEAHGGLGGGPVETMLVMNALGEALLLEPYLAAAVITPALLTRIGDEKASAELLPDIAAGERIVALAHQEPHTRGELDHLTTSARKSGDHYVLDGYKSVIIHGDCADELLVTARTSGQMNDKSGVSVFRVDPRAAGVRITAYATLDGQRGADIELKGVKIAADRLVGAEGEAYPALESAHDLALSAICAEAVGIMKAVNAATLDYTKNRKQFGQPIASFQV